MTMNHVSELLNKQVSYSLAKRAQMASQFSPDSADNGEKPGPTEPKVDPKLQHTGEDYEQAGISEFGLQAQQDLIRNQVDMPIPDKGAAPDTRNALDITSADGVQDGITSAGDPTMEITDPQNHAAEPSVDETLQLKKDAAAILRAHDDLVEMGQKILESLMVRTVQKTSSASQTPIYTQEQMLAESVGTPSAAEIKSAMLPMVEKALYAAELVAVDIKGYGNEKQADFSPETVDPAAAEAMQAPLGQEMPPDEAERLLEQSLVENGVDPSTLGETSSESLPLGAVVPDGPPTDMEGSDGAVSDEEEIEQIISLCEELGVQPEEVIEAMEDLAAEENAGITPEMGAVADEEAEKTGHYKFASFIGRARSMTSDQEKRAASVRRMLRDHVYGPSKKDFN